MAETETGTAERPEVPPGSEWERRRRSPVLALSLLISALVHLLLVMVYPVWMERTVPDSVPPVPPQLVRPQGTEIVAIREVAEAAVDTEPEPEPEEEPEPEVVPEEDEPEPDVGIPDREADELTPAEELRPNEENSRLWAPVDRTLTDLTPEERFQLEIEAAIEAWNDTVAAAGERARAATDWTHTDADGNRWGVSPGKLHLGKVTLPLPFYFGPSNGYERDELAKRAFELRDIDRAASQGAVRESMKERAQAIRERMDAERAAEQAAERAMGGEGQEGEPPDTTRSRR